MAHEWLFPSVNPHMTSQVTFLEEGLVADTAAWDQPEGLTLNPGRQTSLSSSQPLDWGQRGKASTRVGGAGRPHRRRCLQEETHRYYHEH